MEALHDHLRGKSGAASVNLGAVLQGQGGYGGICADGEVRFLKTALLYLSSQEVRKECHARSEYHTQLAKDYFRRKFLFYS